jgi:hypothetical protein
VTAKPPAYKAFRTTEEVVEYLNLTKPLRDRQVVDAAVRALGAPAA